MADQEQNDMAMHGISRMKDKQPLATNNHSRDRNFTEPTTTSPTSTPSPTTSSNVVQLDGPNDPRTNSKPAIVNTIGAAQGPAKAGFRPRATSQAKPAMNAATDLLPYCIADTCMSQDQVIALSDVAGSIKDLALLALGAAVDKRARSILEHAVGPEAATSIIEFFNDEIVADM
jgi:hypothetical protein